jgi:[ribosomal protein S5]-alanine N-acetyltransferase
MQNKIPTERLVLNLLTSEDYAFIISLLNSDGWLKFIGDRKVHSKSDAIAYINKVVETKNLFYWVVRIKDGNIPIGIISFLKRAYLDNFDIGFAFLPEFHGRGYAFEATKIIFSIVSRNPKYYPILATTIPQNLDSIRLLTKLGLNFLKEIEIENEKLHIYTNSTEFH